MIAASVRPLDGSISLFVGERGACLGIDIQAPRQAPDRELIGIDYCPDDDMAAGLQLGLAALGSLLPLAIRRGEKMRILHDFENARIVLQSIPRDTGGTDDGGHEADPQGSNEDPHKSTDAADAKEHPPLSPEHAEIIRQGIG